MAFMNRRRRHKLLMLLYSAAAILPMTVSGFISTSTALAKKSSTTPLFSTSTNTQDLESLTIPELKTILKDNELDKERGILTKLKRKQDLVQYLRDHLEESKGEEAEDVGDEAGDVIGKVVEEPSAPDPTNDTTDDATPPSLQLAPELLEKIPASLQEQMINRDITSLLPIQEAAFERIYNGKDTILQSPTGSGKTLAFVLPLLSRRQAHAKKKVASPIILTIVPSRELAQQVGKEYEKMIGGKHQVATVFGGVPLERHIALLKYKPRVVVATPGRLRELVREGHLDYSQLATLVLDEADLLLNPGDSPDVLETIDEIEETLPEDAEYQMVLVSATIGQHVQDFAKEMQFPTSAFVKVETSEASVDSSEQQQATTTDSSSNDISEASKNAVGHWHMSCKASVRPEITANLISVWSPRLTIIFVPTKTATESVAAFLSEKASGATIRILHGDMSQSARSRCIATLRDDAVRKEANNQILVATDVASRGLDLPNVDLVVQFGLPRVSGKEGTINAELYAHRTGRTGRYQSSQQRYDNSNEWRAPSNRYQTSNAVVLYDPAEGEGRLVQPLVEEVSYDLGVAIQPMAIPSSAQVVEAAYTRLSSNVLNEKQPSLLSSYFREKLERDHRIDTSNAQELLDRLAEAMVALSKLDPSTSPHAPTSSLLTGDPTEITLRLYPKNNAEQPLNPPAVTSFCKSLGSGKLGRVVICKDGSAVFDLPRMRARRILESIQAADNGNNSFTYDLEVPCSLPEV